MNGRGFITISMHELERVKIIESVVQRRLTVALCYPPSINAAGPVHIVDTGARTHRH